MKIRPGGAEVFHADRAETDKKLTVAFGNRLNAPKTTAQSHNYVTMQPSKPKIQLNLFFLLRAPTAHCPFDHIPLYNLQFPTLHLISRTSLS